MPPEQAELFSAQPPATQEPKRKSGGCLKGCLIALVVMLLVAAVAGWYVAMNWRNLAASLGTQAVEQMLSQSGLPAEEQAEVRVEVDRIAGAFRSGELTMEESVELIEQVAQSPVMSTFIVMGIEQGYLVQSGLTDEEQAAGSKALRRFGRGFVDGSIPSSAMDDLMRHVADRDAKGRWRVRDPLPDADLKALLAAAAQKADEGGVPAEIEPIDPSDEIKKLVDEALAPSGE